MVLFLAHDLKDAADLYRSISYDAGHTSGDGSRRTEKYIHIAHEKSLRLGELINEFFDITRYNLQDIELEPVNIHLSLMLEQLADELYAVLQEKHLSCEVDVEENLEVTGDPDKLARVF